MKLIVRCSELKSLMTKSRTKSDPLSQTTKSWLQNKAKEAFYGYRSSFESKYTSKGIDVEDDAITMLSGVYFDTYLKNQERFTNEWLTGEPDVITDTMIRDVKSSWSLETFPAFYEDAVKEVKKSGYDWQVRGYMLLCDKDKASVDYCMMTTPAQYLNDWDNMDIHHVEHIDPLKRITSVEVLRDKELEQQMKAQYELANAYYLTLVKELESK